MHEDLAVTSAELSSQQQHTGRQQMGTGARRPSKSSSIYHTCKITIHCGSHPEDLFAVLCLQPSKKGCISRKRQASHVRRRGNSSSLGEKSCIPGFGRRELQRGFGSLGFRIRTGKSRLIRRTFHHLLPHATLWEELTVDKERQSLRCQTFQRCGPQNVGRNVCTDTPPARHLAALRLGG